MIFSSYRFLFVFLPIAYGGFLLLRKIAPSWAVKLWLVAASLVFYAQGEPVFFPVLLCTALFNYAVARAILRAPAKSLRLFLFLLALSENLGLLFYFKYRNFFFENINRLTGASLPLARIILPLGISFYTFQILLYVIDCYKEQGRAYSLLDFLAFVTFFPLLVVGPIVRADAAVPQLAGDGLKRRPLDAVMPGILVFSMGCAKKVLLADPLIAYAQSFYRAVENGGFFDAWCAVFAFTFAYYFDFSGYSDMAVGLGLLFNVRLPFNFNSPYKARNFADFWRRWNITVSNFLNETVFKNLFHFGNGLFRLFFAIMATFLVSGLWHGAGWHYLVWGAANGILVMAAHLMTLNRKRLPFPLAWALTFFFVLLTRVLFDSANTAQAADVYRLMFDVRVFAGFADFWRKALAFCRGHVAEILLLFVCGAVSFGAKNSAEIIENFTPTLKNAVFAGVLLAVSLFFMGSVSSFLYFQF